MPILREDLLLALVITNVLLVLAVAVMALRLRRFERAMALTDVPSLDRALSEAKELRSAIQRRVDALERETGHLRRTLEGCVQHVGIVRYDAFKDMGGQMSFSMALLDGRQDGMVVSVLNGREEARIYAKPVKSGQSTHSLSEEERTALAQALGQ
ncbi:MAG: DUF4446 family protein [Armatimonadetes bacterium]|nr:DUF4446 family protein [Armatimonadota bacterium]